jgi:hypothetical protein
VKRVIVSTAIASCAVIGLTTPAFAGSGNPSPTGTGQPSQTCLSTATGPNEPGHAGTSPGSVFNEPGNTGPNDSGGTANVTYNGNGAPSQYDVACFHVSH